MKLNKIQFFKDISIMFATMVGYDSVYRLFSGDLLGFLAGLFGLVFVILMVYLNNLK